MTIPQSFSSMKYWKKLQKGINMMDPPSLTSIFQHMLLGTLIMFVLCKVKEVEWITGRFLQIGLLGFASSEYEGAVL